MTNGPSTQREAENRLRQMAAEPYIRTENVPTGYRGTAVGDSARLPQPLAEKPERSGFLSSLRHDDILLGALFVLLFNENKEDDILILLILAILLFS